MAKRSADSNFIVRFFFIHCFLHVYNILTSKDITSCFTPPRFNLYKKINQTYLKGKSTLFNDILNTFKSTIFQGACVTVIFVSFNLLVPTLIKLFMHYMHQHHSEQSQVKEASSFIQILIGIQLLRVLFGEHTRRIFHELAIQIESILSKKLIVKSLNLTQKARKDIPHSEILQLENVDLKLVFIMFNNFYYLFEAPLTIIIALIMLFIQSPTYGFIGAYWFLIAFLLHRELDENMTHCNQTKFELIQKRSKLNYEILNQIKQAKIIGWQDVIVQKNNDLFNEQNHDHYLFYFYNSLYDIILLMLPVLVVVSICVWDYGEAQPITVQQVYMMLSLLGICYIPMKEFRAISISFHDGLRSLNRLQQYFSMPDEQISSSFIDDRIATGHLIVKEGTSVQHSGDIFDFSFRCDLHVQASPGDRLVILGRTGQGKTSFLNMICGLMSGIQGGVKISGRIAYLPDQFFFLKSRIRDNIAFYNDNVSQEEIQYIGKELGLVDELQKLGGLNSIMEDTNLYTRSQLQRISLARVLCSKASIYVLDTPFQELDREYEDVIEHLLREKQKNDKVLVVTSFNHLDFLDQSDKIVIVAGGEVKQFGRYGQLAKNPKSSVKKFFKSKENKDKMQSEHSLTLGQKKRIGNIFGALKGFQPSSHESNGVNPFMQLMSPTKMAIKKLLEHRVDQLKKQKQLKKTHKVSLGKYIFEFLNSVPLKEVIFIMIIIACAELLHVFIHFWIGHLEEQHGQNSYLKFQNMIVIEVVLTFCLSGILYYQGDFSSMIAIIQGNNMYKQSLVCLTNKRISWFTKQYFVRIADRFNHDYQEVFIACHSLLQIYKNIIILITTVFFISSNGVMAALVFITICIFYVTIFVVFRKVQRLIVHHYYDYKYQFVKTFEESLEGSTYFRVFGIKDYLIKRAELKYKRLASYKLAQRYTNIGLSIVCDLTSNILLAAVISYGLQNKIHNTRFNIAMIATSIHLMMNGAQVLKNIVKQTIGFETFFQINLVPFLEINTEKFQKQNNKIVSSKFTKNERPLGYEIRFRDIILKEPGHVTCHQKFNLNIPEDQVVALFQANDAYRNLLVYSLTQNIGIISNPQYYQSIGNILIGGTDIRQIDPQYRRQILTVIMGRNFYLSGTLRENLVRKYSVSDDTINHYVHLLRIDHDVEDYDLMGLDAPIYFQSSKINYQLTKKFAIARALIYKSKIIIIKDTSIYIDSIPIVQVLKQNIEECTIIILTNKIESAIGASRIISMENLIIHQDGCPEVLKQNEYSVIGALIRNTNLQGYIYMNKVSKVVKKKRKNPNKLAKKATLGVVKKLLDL